MMGDIAKCGYLRQVDKSPAPYYYIKASLEYEGKGLEMDALQFKHVIMQALTEVFGKIGASDTIDVLKLSSSGEAVLRVPSRCFVKLWGTLCLFGKHNGQACAFRVQQVSHTPYSVTILSLFQAFAFHLRVQNFSQFDEFVLQQSQLGSGRCAMITGDNWGYILIIISHVTTWHVIIRLGDFLERTLITAGQLTTWDMSSSFGKRTHAVISGS